MCVAERTEVFALGLLCVVPVGCLHRCTLSHLVFRMKLKVIRSYEEQQTARTLGNGSYRERSRRPWAHGAGAGVSRKSH